MAQPENGGLTCGWCIHTVVDCLLSVGQATICIWGEAARGSHLMLPHAFEMGSQGLHCGVQNGICTEMAPARAPGCTYMFGVQCLTGLGVGWLARSSRVGVGVAGQATAIHALTGLDYKPRACSSTFNIFQYLLYRLKIQYSIYVTIFAVLLVNIQYQYLLRNLQCISWWLAGTQ